MTGSSRMLHLATQGFFFPHPKTVDGSEPVFWVVRHPMIREGMEDGILTAYEISQMNLSNTELVVLSACETGLGDIQGNEGVYGLQRAFKIAVAKCLVMSLWQVEDQATMKFMEVFLPQMVGGQNADPRSLSRYAGGDA